MLFKAVCTIEETENYLDHLARERLAIQVSFKQN